MLWLHQKFPLAVLLEEVWFGFPPRWGRQWEKGGSAQSLFPGAGIMAPAHKGTWLRLRSLLDSEGSSCQNLCSRGCGQSQASGYMIVKQFSFIIFGWPQSPVKELFPSALTGAGFSLVLEWGRREGDGGPSRSRHLSPLLPCICSACRRPSPSALAI